MAEQATDSPSRPAGGGTFAPLAQATFAVLWAATILGNVGSFMRDVASAWLATDLSSSPAAVATIQAAATLPVFLLAIPAGVLSDILDRRRFLIAIQIGLALVSGTLMMLAWRNALTIEILIGMAFLGGIGAALMGPTWQSIVPELVPQHELKRAVALNALGVNIARAIAPGPRLVVLDEPTSALDVSLRARIILLLDELRARLGMTYLFISHDLATVKYLAHRVAVMYLGTIVEQAPTRELFARPLHPYTRALLSAVPIPDPLARRDRLRLAGEVPSPVDVPAGCRLRRRCPLAQPVCAEPVPLREVAPTHLVACHLV